MAKKNTSAKKKLIPAVAMLTTSAIMLSTATYAWFTMNKEVQVTGLSMSATASEGLEISLGEMTNGTKPTINAPGKDDLSWKRAIQFKDYYSTVGKLMPASSDTALTLYKVASSGVYAGGHAVEEGTAITAATKQDSATLSLKTTTNDTNMTISTDDDKDAGYYIDVPMWIRSSTNKATEVKCTVTITDGETKEPAEDLMKAVRVAIIPTGSGANSAAIAQATNEGSATTAWADDNADANTLTASTSATIFGLNSTTYNEDKVIGAAGTYATADLKATTVETAAAALTTNDNLKPDGENVDAAKAPATTVFTLPKADENEYAGVAFVARIWIEGESTSCEDATADQDWQVDFHFSTDTTANNG